MILLEAVSQKFLFPLGLKLFGGLDSFFFFPKSKLVILKPKNSKPYHLLKISMVTSDSFPFHRLILVSTLICLPDGALAV